MRYHVLLTSLFFLYCTSAISGVEPAIDEVEKLNQALAAIGCTGGEMEKNIGDVTTYEVDDSICDKGQFDIKFDNDFKIIKQKQD